MELWVFDPQNNALLDIIETYSSVKLNGQYDALGGIEFIAPLNLLDNGRMSPGMIVWPKRSAGAINEPYQEAYIIESTKLTARAGGTELTARGRTLSGLLARRCLPDVRYHTGKAGLVIRRLMESVFGDTARAFPGWSMQASDGLGDNITLLTSGETLLEAVETVCRGSGLGYRTVFDPATMGMQFQIYEGLDRWASDAAEPVTLNPEYDNLLGLSAEDSTEEFRNVMYVIGETNAELGVTRKIVADAMLEAGGARASGLNRFEGAVRYSAASITDGPGSAVGLPAGTSGGSVQLTEAQYQATMKAFAMSLLRSSARGTAISGTLDMAQWPDLALGDIVRVRARGWDVDAAARVRALEIRIANGVESSYVMLGAV
ncbi:hypothetical protein AGMMS49992_08310 [Clostridia bacterium]|nr:hypothetical protein AGMMS49992_08310 [Clostridia bacterium]